MKILLATIRRSEKPVLPMGLLYIGAVLEENGYAVNAHDLVFKEDEDRFMEEAARSRPGIIGLSFLTTAVEKTRELVRRLREECAGSIIVGGGAHCTGLPRESLQELGLDYAFYGEGEHAFLAFCNAVRDGTDVEGIGGLIHQNNGDTVVNPVPGYIEDLDALPFPAWHLIDMENYLFPPGYIKGLFFRRTAPVMTSRGCPALCIFCSSPHIFGRKIRRRSVPNVIEEIKTLKERYRIDGIFFLDDTFTLNPAWVNEFCRAMTDARINLPWSCQTRVNVVTKELLETMKRAGCVQVDYGIESGSPRMLKEIKKGTTVEQVRNAFRIAREVGLRTYGSVLIGNPGETWEDVMMSKELVRELKPSLTLFNFLTPFPGSELYDTAFRNGWISKDKDKLYAYDTRTADDSILISGMSTQQLREARSELQNLVFFRNYLAYLNLRNFSFIAEVSCYCLLHPVQILRGVRKALRNKALDDLIDAVYYVYCKEKKQQRNRP